MSSFAVAIQKKTKFKASFSVNHHHILAGSYVIVRKLQILSLTHGEDQFMKRKVSVEQTEPLFIKIAYTGYRVPIIL
jgi:hypothetical protein